MLILGGNAAAGERIEPRGSAVVSDPPALQILKILPSELSLFIKTTYLSSKSFNKHNCTAIRF